MADQQSAAPAIAQARNSAAFIAILIAVTVLVRLPGIARPLVGDFATKNVVYAMIARNWAEGRAALWTPTLDLLAGGERAWHLVEFPVSAYTSGALWRLFGGSLDAWGRGTAIVWSAASVALLYALARRWHGETAARGAAAVLALAPVSIIYGQSFMLESSVVALALGTLLAFELWHDSRRSRWLALAALAFSLLLLTKIYMLVLLLPLGWTLIGRSDQRPNDACWRRIVMASVALGLAILPAACWYLDAAALSAPNAPTVQRVYYSIRQSAMVHALPHALLADPAFYSGVLHNLATVALTPVGLVLLIAGGWHRGWRRHAAWLVSAVVLMVVLPRKFHEMNYYYLVILPPLCVMAGLGWEIVTRLTGRRSRLALVVSLGVLCSMRYALRPAFVTPAEDAMVVATARRVQALTGPDDWVVTMHGSTIDLLYYCNRPGLAIDPSQGVLDTCLARWSRNGAALLAVAQHDGRPLPSQTRRLLDRLESIESGPGYRLYQLPRLSAAAVGDRRHFADESINLPRLARVPQD